MSPISRITRAIEAQVPQKMLRDRWNRLRYGPEAPLSDECIWVDPLAVKYSYAGMGDRPLRRGSSGLVLPGDWDLAVKPIAENTKERSLRLHFEDGLPWSETPIYQKLLKKIENGQRPDELTSRADLDARYAAIDQLWERARKDGLRPRSELPSAYRREHNGILLHLGRDGRLIREGGAMHRFAIARLIPLPFIPAQLGVVHPDALAAGHLRLLRQDPRTART